MRSEVAEAALGAGAQLVNDVSGGLADPRILDVVAGSAATYVAMHWRAHSDRMQDLAVYDEPGGVVAAVRRELAERVDAIRAAGVPDDRIVLDPGLGFAKRGEHNWTLLRGFAELVSLGFPLLVGASRKSFLGGLLADPGGPPRPVDDWRVPPLRRNEDPADPEVAWSNARRGPQPRGTFEEKAQLGTPLEARGFALTYIVATERPDPGPVFDQTAARLRGNPRWSVREISGGHNMMRTNPRGLAALLLELAAVTPAQGAATV
jgi:hypothetical protein